MTFVWLSRMKLDALFYICHYPLAKEQQYMPSHKLFYIGFILNSSITISYLNSLMIMYMVTRLTRFIQGLTQFFDCIVKQTSFIRSTISVRILISVKKIGVKKGARSPDQSLAKARDGFCTPIGILYHWFWTLIAPWIWRSNIHL